MTSENESKAMSDEERIAMIRAKAEGSSSEYRHDIEFLVTHVTRATAEAEAELAVVKQQRSDNLKAIADRDRQIAEAGAVIAEALGASQDDLEHVVMFLSQYDGPQVLARVKAEAWDEGAAEERNAILNIIQDRSEYLKYEDLGSAWDMDQLWDEISQRG